MEILVRQGHRAGQGGQGLRGATGATGRTGPAGPQGAQGPKGDDGLDGADGTQLTGGEHPVVQIVSSTSHPPIPNGLWRSCLADFGTTSSSTCPIITFNGYTYWAYSYTSNSLNLAIVAYDSSNNVVNQTNLSGVRYINNISVNTRTNTVTFQGQSMNTRSMNYTPLPFFLTP